MSALRLPFGEADCESEVKLLEDDYSKLFFAETPFNEAAIEPATYLIIGRRGAGKTALSRYFSFQDKFPNPIYIDVDEPTVYEKVLSEISGHTAASRDVAVPRLQQLWNYLIWCLIFEHTRHTSPIIERGCHPDCANERASRGVKKLIERMLVSLRRAETGEPDHDFDDLLRADVFRAAREEVVKHAHKRAVIVAVDTLERYNVDEESLMNAMAALIQCAASFNLEYANRGIHLKVFMSGEVFPWLLEQTIQNPLKSIKSPVFLLWRPKDLLRLISWRLHRYLKEHGQLHPDSVGDIDWEDPQQVLLRMWNPYFGATMRNGRGLQERTFTYILRHTQMRPRQLIVLCNAIAGRSRVEGMFPYFSEDSIRSAVRSTETQLAIEVLNSYQSIYPKVNTIVDALSKMPMVFHARELDRRASESAADWPPGSYSPARFRRLLAELGIVGRVRRKNEVANYIDADFEYALPDRLLLTSRDECVVHPMFYRRFNVECDFPYRVMPFSTERDVIEGDARFA